MLQDFPYTGVGLNMFPRVLQVLYPPFSFSPDTLVPHAHNQLLQVGVDLGIPGLVAYIALIVCFFVSTARVMLWSAHPQRRALAGGLVFGMLAFQTFGLFDAIALGSEPDLIFWIALALSASLNIRESLTNSEIPQRESGPGRREGPAASFRPGQGRYSQATREFGRPVFIWLTGSLLSIAFVGDQPYLGLILALLSGIAVGLASIIAYDQASPIGSPLQAGSLFVQVR